MLERRYPAKLLWFGEYTVVEGGDALAGPLTKYYGRWSSGPNNLQQQLLCFLDSLDLRAQLKTNVDLVNGPLNGYYANIPQGRGLGSSGALAAALYDLIAQHNTLSIADKWSDLGKIEGYWHGKSSGFDALVSLEKTALLRQGSSIQVVNPENHTAHFYLLDSGQPRKTRELIEHFGDLLGGEAFRKNLSRATEVVTKIISSVLRGEPFLEHLAALSIYQYEQMLDFIIEPLREPWLATLQRTDLHLKLCGAGGGGYYYLICQREIPNLLWEGFPLTEVSFNIE